jgi:tetratricopeptide (TPR) repeat protein
MTSRIHGLSLSSIALPQSLKLPHRLTLLFGAVLLVGTASYLVARSLMHRAHVRAVGTLYEQGNQNFTEGKYEEAIQNYEEALRHNPTENVRKKIDAGLVQSKFEHCRELARKNHTLKNYDEALKYFREALSHNPIDKNILAEIHSDMGAIHLAQKNYYQAQDSYEKALNCTPTDLTIQKVLADIEQHLKPKSEQSNHRLPAEKAEKKDKNTVVEKKPTNPAQKYYEKGLQTLDNTDEAIKNFSSALVFEPVKELKEQISYQLGVCYRKKQQYSLALLYFSGMLSAVTSDKKLYATISLERGFLLDIDQQNLESAIACYQVVIELTHDKGVTYDPKLQAIALFLKGNGLLRVNLINPDRLLRVRHEALRVTILALDYAQRVEPLDNQLLIELHYQKGLCYQALEQFDAAINGYQDALKLVKNPYIKASILCDLAFCYRQAARTSEALEPYNQALQCEFSDEYLEEKQEFLGGVPLKTLKRGTSASLKNSTELKSMIEASIVSIEKITGVD